jgi:sec-independent protein translocase protein TatC
VSGDDEAFPFLEHLEEMRKTFIQCLLIIAAGCVIAFACYQPIIDWFTAPLHLAPSLHGSLVPEHLVTSRVVNNKDHEQIYVLQSGAESVSASGSGVEEVSFGTYKMQPGASLTYSTYKPAKQALVVLGPLDGMAVAMKTAFWVGLTLTAPLWGYCVARFVAPGLRQRERRGALAFVLVSAAFMAFGAVFAYKVTIPLANAYLAQFNAVIGENWWSLGNYLDYTLFLLIANAVAFQCGVIGLFAVHYGMISAQFLTEHRRHAIVAALVLGALLTPPDIATQLMLAIPLLGLYEFVIVYAKAQKFYK